MKARGPLNIITKFKLIPLRKSQELGGKQSRPKIAGRLGDDFLSGFFPFFIYLYFNEKFLEKRFILEAFISEFQLFYRTDPKEWIAANWTI